MFKNKQGNGAYWIMQWLKLMNSLKLQIILWIGPYLLNFLENNTPDRCKSNIRIYQVFHCIWPKSLVPGKTSQHQGQQTLYQIVIVVYCLSSEGFMTLKKSVGVNIHRGELLSQS